MYQLIKNKSFFIEMFFVAFFLILGPAQAATNPDGWPWYGVSMDSLSSMPTDLRRYHAVLGISTVRLQLKPDKLAKRQNGSPDKAWEKSLKWLDYMLDECKSLSIRSIVNMSYFPIDPSYNPNAKIKVPQYSPQFWSDEKQIDNVVYTVSLLMKHLKGRGSEVIAIDIMSEPALQDGAKLVAPKGWRNLMDRLVEKIREESADVWILISPPPLSLVSSYEGFQPFQDNRVVYSAHFYSPEEFTGQGIGRKKFGPRYRNPMDGKVWNAEVLKEVMGPLRVFQKKHQVPVVIGEFSAVRWAEGGEQYIKDLVAIFNDYGWGWLYFSGSGWHGWNPDYNHHFPGKDNGENRWQEDFVGEQSLRWQTLREIFSARSRGGQQ